MYKRFLTELSACFPDKMHSKYSGETTLNNCKVTEITTADECANQSPTQCVEGSRNSFIKMTYSRSPFDLEKLHRKLKVLLVLSTNCGEAINIDDICRDISVEYDYVIANKADEVLDRFREKFDGDRLSLFQIMASYDLILLDRRQVQPSPPVTGRPLHNPRIKQLEPGFVICDVDHVVTILRSANKKSHCKIIAYVDKSTSDFFEYWQKGYDEIWVNYKPLVALRNYLRSFQINQHIQNLFYQRSSLVMSVFDRLVDGVAVISNSHEILTVNGTYSKLFHITLKDVVGKNWFDFHTVSEAMRDSILCELRNKSYWEGFLTPRLSSNGQSVVLQDIASDLFVVMKPLDSLDGNVIVSINTVMYGHRNSVEGAFSINSCINSYEIDSSLSTIRNNRDSMINTIAIDSPIIKVMKIISNIQEYSSPVVFHNLQKIVDILSSKDLYITTTADTLKADKMSSNLIDGLLSNNATIYSQTENRRQSTSLMKIQKFTRKYYKVNKIPEIPETEEFSVIDELLESYNQWTFDILQLERLTEYKPLRYLGMKVFHSFDLGTTLQVDRSVFQNWLYVVESNYNETNTYHNSTHAADVLQSSVWFLQRPIISDIFDSFDDAASIIGAIIHDLGHPGRTNPFLINSNHNLAVLYNDVAVLENHHVSFSFKLTLKDDRINIFKNLNSDDYRSLRHSIIDSVLATEMAKHFEHLTKFVSNICIHNHASASATPTSTMSSSKQLTGADSTSPVSDLNLELLRQPENKGILRRMLIKCSDVNNPSRPFPLCKEWASRISEEYFNQTDEELNKGLPVVMPHFNRKTCDIPKSQISFIEIFLENMFQRWSDFIQSSELLLHLHENKRQWKNLIDTTDSSKTISIS